MKKEKNNEELAIQKLASCGLTNKEIAEALGYDDNTLKRNFEIFLIKGKANLKERLKRKQIQVAMQGNVTMLIWLGKQYLGQAEKIEESGEYKIIVERKNI
jgi:DNA-binding CsgD family transcriptional regulator